MDQAWTVMLCKQGLIPREPAEKVLEALEKTEFGGEAQLERLLKDEELASIPIIGRTLQEPMARMQRRGRVEAGYAKLRAEVRAILGEPSK